MELLKDGMIAKPAAHGESVTHRDPLRLATQAQELAWIVNKPVNKNQRSSYQVLFY